MQQVWKQTVMGIVYATIIYMVAQFLSAVCAGLSVAAAIFNGGGGGWLTMAILFVLAMIGGFVWYFMNLSKFITLQKNDTDRTTTKNILVANIILIGVSVFTTLLSLFVSSLVGTWIQFLTGIGMYIWLMICYGAYSRSTVIGENAKSGASLLKVGCILALIGTVLSIIPVAGTVLNALCMIAYIVLLFVGWVKIANGAPAEA